MSILKNISTINSFYFTFDAETKTITAEASTLSHVKGFNPMCRIFDDAVDEGFKIKSSKTGAEEIFTYSKEERSADGEILAWIFVPYSPKLSGWTVHIFND